MFNKIYKRVTRPQPDADDDNEEYLDEEALELVHFHRIGFGVNDDGWVNDIFIDNTTTDRSRCRIASTTADHHQQYCRHTIAIATTTTTNYY